VYDPEPEGVTDSLPLLGSEPDHAPLAVHVVAFVEDQVSMLLPPSVMDVGSKEMLTVGAGAGVTVRMALPEMLPALFVQVSV
jgi:hypothetical protein